MPSVYLPEGDLSEEWGEVISSVDKAAAFTSAITYSTFAEVTSPDSHQDPKDSLLSYVKLKIFA